MPPTPSSCRRIRRLVLFLALSVTLSLNAAAGLLWYSPMDGNANAVVSSLGQSTTVGSVSWEYVDGLSGGTRTTGGTVGGEDAFIVLDGAAGRGIQINAGAACPCGSKTTSLL